MLLHYFCLFVETDNADLLLRRQTPRPPSDKKHVTMAHIKQGMLRTIITLPTVKNAPLIFPFKFGVGFPFRTAI